GLLFELRSENLHPFRLLRDSSFQVLHLFVLLKELVEQHRVDLVRSPKLPILSFIMGRLCQGTAAVSVNSGFQFVLIRAIRERQEIPAEESLLIRAING